MLGLFFTGKNYCIGRLNKPDKERCPAQQGRLYAVPLSGSLTLGTATIVAFPGSDAGVSIFFVSALIGGFLSMLVGWPVLWLIEGYLQTPLLYIAGGMIAGLLIWTFTSLPNLFQALSAILSPSTSFPRTDAWPKYVMEGMACLFF
ncbi:hypothetical protein GIV19_22965 [Pseudomonas syringae]|uniref:hypothetical protein n=1 Tax=Pseudomonas syringae TaxID=317 RepID=UPI001F1A513C|nr:hypothetical protein [Pseudomonas syringae]MCF5710121.1 hypothetical protein [Pseudomonas syringae]